MTTENVVFNGVVPELHKNKEKEEENGKKNTMATKEIDEEQQLLPYLGQDVVTKILVKVRSAESLYNSLRYFCKSWSNVIFHNPDIHLNTKQSPSIQTTGDYLAIWYFFPDKVKLSESRTFHVHVIEDLHKPGAKWKVLHGGVIMNVDFIKVRQSRPVLSICNGEVIIFRRGSQGALWAYNFRSQCWWRVGHCLKEWDTLSFSGFHVISSTHVPFDSLFSTV